MTLIPNSRAPKSYAIRIAFITGLGCGLFGPVIEIYSTYSFIEIPTAKEMGGLFLVFITSFGLGIGYVVGRYSDDLIVDNPFSGRPVTYLVLIGAADFLAIDAALFSSQGLRGLALITSKYQSLFSILLTFMLVLLYFDQHKTQRKQVELMEKQSELAHRQTSWKEAKERPRLKIKNWDLIGNDETSRSIIDSDVSVDDLASFLTSGYPGDFQALFVGKVINKGETPARSVDLQIQMLVQSDDNDLPDEYIHLNWTFITIHTGLTRLEENILDQRLNPNPVSINKRETKEVLGGISIHTVAQSGDSIDSLDELVQRLPFSIQNVLFRASLVYQGPIGEKHTEEIAAMQVPPEDLENLPSAFKPENQVEFHRFRSLDEIESLEYLIFNFADSSKSDHRGTKFEYHLTDGEGKAPDDET